MELRHLRYFLAVAETANFRRAAERQFVAQSALSQQIARLEAELGAPLFHRTTRSVRLTPAGERLQPLARRILAEVEHAESEIAAMTGLTLGRVALGVIQTGSALDAVKLVGSYHERHPGIDMSVRSGTSTDLSDAVRAGELDAAVIGLPPQELASSLRHFPLVDDPLVAILSPEASRGLKGAVSLAEIVTRGPFIHYLRGSGLRYSVTTALDRAGLAVDSAFELAHITDMIRLAALGVGVTVVPATTTHLAAYEADRTPDFEVFALEDRRAVHCIGVVHEQGRLNPAARALLDMLLETR